MRRISVDFVDKALKHHQNFYTYDTRINLQVTNADFSLSHRTAVCVCQRIIQPQHKFRMETVPSLAKRSTMASYRLTKKEITVLGEWEN